VLRSIDQVIRILGNQKVSIEIIQKVLRSENLSWNKFEEQAAIVISAVINPLVIPTLGLLILLNQDTHLFFAIPDAAKWIIILLVLTNTAILPMISIVLLKRAGIVNDVLLQERNDRIVPMLLSAVYCIATYFLFAHLSLPGIITVNILGLAVLVILSTIITFFWKISLHMVSVGGLTGLVAALPIVLKTDSSGLLPLLFLLSGMVGTARLRLNAHNSPQVFAGFLMGFWVMYFLIIFRA